MKEKHCFTDVHYKSLNYSPNVIYHTHGVLLYFDQLKKRHYPKCIDTDDSTTLGKSMLR